MDRQRRARIVPNHTFTHVLNLALKQQLGDHIDQKVLTLYLRVTPQVTGRVNECL